jgi:hypothetical protein
MTTGEGSIEATGHELWIPLPLEGPSEVVTQQLTQRFGDDDSVADQIALLTGVVTQLQQANDQDEGVLNLAGWALVRRPDQLDVRTLATLRAVAVDEGTTAEEVGRGLAAGSTLFEEPTLTEVETMSGDALGIRLRPMVEEGDSTQVHEAIGLVWLREGDQVCFLLSTYVDDLVEALEIGDLLDELGAGIKGL